jgi:hypothetical protein
VGHARHLDLIYKAHHLFLGDFAPWRENNFVPFELFCGYLKSV